jgi:Leucine-rich repeat (LRR) protein
MHRTNRLKAGAVLPALLALSLPGSHAYAVPFQSGSGKKAAVAPAEASTVATPRSAVVFGCGGKIGPKEEGFIPGFESYKLRFGPGDWAGARIIITSAWGDKNPSTDLWNWPDGLDVRATDVKSDKDGFYFVYSLATANAANWIVANFRYTLRDGRSGVADAVIPYGGDPGVPKETVAVLACDGRLGPKEEGYIPEFESYKLRFGPGDWAGTKISLSSSWGEGSDTADLWGYKDGTEARSSDVRRDARGDYFVHSLRDAGHSRWVASLFRFTKKDGRSGVAQALYSYSGALPPPKPAGQPAGYPVAPAPVPRKFPKPTARVLAAARPTRADLIYLQSLSDVLKGMDVEELAAVTKLDLRGKAIEDEGMVHLRGLKSLRTLSLQGTRVGDAGLENIAALTGLLELDLLGTPTTDAGLEVVGRLAGLTSLNLTNTLVTDSALRSIRRLKSLESLSLAGTDVGDAGLAVLKNLPALRNLNLAREPGYVNERFTAAGLALLKALPRLEYLSLSYQPIGDDVLAQLSGMPRLNFLDLRATDITGAGLVHLKALPELAHLVLNQTRLAGEGLAPLTSIPKLRSLYLDFTDVGDEGLVRLAGLRNLRSLSIIKGNVTDAGLAQLRGLTNLERLILPDNKKITGAGVENLRGLTKLSELNLYADHLDNASLAVLRSLPELRQVYVSGERITDAGLVHLKALPNLEYISISWTKATQAGIDDLKKSRPGLRVVYGDY